MSLDTLLSEISRLDKQKNWKQQDPADLAKSIVIEAAELLEHFQWDNTSANSGQATPSKNKQEIGYEAADIFIYLLKFCREMDIDLMETTFEKLKMVKARK